MNLKFNFRFSVLLSLIVFAAFSRVIPHPANFSPLGAIALFGAAYFKRSWQSLVIPILTVWLSDLFINNIIYKAYYPTFTFFYDGFLWTYMSYVLIGLYGMLVLKKIDLKRIITGITGATAIFFFVSNIGCWAGNTNYSQTFSGLVDCYIAGIPYLSGTILGDVCYGIVLFGGFSLAQHQFPKLKQVEQ